MPVPFLVPANKMTKETFVHEYFKTLVRYNAWANTRLSESAMGLDDEDFDLDRGAFFGSLHGTLDHILLVDRIWRGRITGSLYPFESLADSVTTDRAAYVAAREAEDATWIDFVDGLTDADMDRSITYITSTGEQGTDPLYILFQHTFNHATHHRGQAHALMSQVPVDPPPLDFVAYLRTL